MQERVRLEEEARRRLSEQKRKAAEEEARIRKEVLWYYFMLIVIHYNFYDIDKALERQERERQAAEAKVRVHFA